MPIKVLVFPCGSEIGLEISAALRYSKFVELFGVSSVADHGEFAYRRYREVNAHVDSPDFIDQLNTLIAEWGIDIVMPAHDSVMLRLAQGREQLQARVVAPEPAIAEVCRNKNATYDFLADCDFIPQRIRGLAEHYPIFAKPAVGQGSQGAERVDSAARHAQLIDSGREYVFAEYLPGAEYTLDCISSHDGELLHVSPRRRLRIKAGISVRTEAVATDERMLEMAAAIAERLRLKGAWFFQIKQAADGRFKLLEVAPRIAGSMGMSRALGINYPLLTLYAHLDMAFSVLPQQYPIQLDRAFKNCYRAGLHYERVYLDLDDTLIVNGKVNLLLISLLYQWAMAGIPCVLVTRHAGVPEETLKRQRISPDLFERIVHIRDESPKSSVIPMGEAALFIDDSYRERLDVSQVHGIPVLDVDAAEQLMDWRA